MPIEFRCNMCNKLLRVGDENAGKKSRCPECGNIQDIPFNPPGESSGGAPRAAPYSPGAGYAPAASSQFGQAPPAASPPHQPTTGSPHSPYSSAGNPYADRPQSSNPYATPAAGYGHQPYGSIPRSVAEGRVQGPAIGMMVMAIMMLLFCGMAVVGVFMEGPDDEAVGAAVMLLFCGGLQVIIVWGAMMMKNLKGYGLAIAASVLSILASPCCFGLPMIFGIWSLVVLCDSGVKGQFQ